MSHYRIPVEIINHIRPEVVGDFKRELQRAVNSRPPRPERFEEDFNLIFSSYIKPTGQIEKTEEL